MKYLRQIRTAFRILRLEGVSGLRYRLVNKVRTELTVQRTPLPVKTADALAADWTRPPEQLSRPRRVASGTMTIAWVMSPPSENSGGHQNLFRFIDFAEKAGHRCLIYFYTSAPVVVNSENMRAMLDASSGYPNVRAEMAMYDGELGISSEADAVFATSWETAYPVFLDASDAKRFYFVQDFEPAFYPVGTESLLAENTYRFGFHGITAGGWLAQKLHDEYGMETDHFDFAVDRSVYSLSNTERRNEIFFYARPTTARRGFDLGIMALERFAELRPDVTINLAGWDVSGYDIPFAYENLAGVEVGRLSELYNRCAAALVVSATNMSLLPLELIAAGAAPVVNDAPNNRLVSDNPYIEYVPAVPAAMADRLVAIVDRADGAEHSIAMAESVASVTWADSGAQFIDALERAMHG